MTDITLIVSNVLHNVSIVLLIMYVQNAKIINKYLNVVVQEDLFQMKIIVMIAIQLLLL